MTKDAKPTGLALLREPFPAHQISKLPKPTAKQTEEAKPPKFNGIRCQICGTWHHPDVVHLDYVGHAALTDRLLDCDPEWNWEPLALAASGTPAVDSAGGMWIRLTVCGVTRLGYGHPDGKTGGNAIKETIGDALRNAAMRFGAALDLWHKGDLHGDEDAPETAPPKDDTPQFIASAAADRILKKLSTATTIADLGAAWKSETETLTEIKAASPPIYAKVDAAKNKRKADLALADSADVGAAEIPY